MDVEVELVRIIISETSDQQVIVLREKQGERAFPIVIGFAEAWAIDRRMKGIETPRPMTHDLMCSIIHEMGGRLERVVVCDLADQTFFAKLMVRQGEEVLEIDSRPSDAIALAASQDVPLFVAEHVLTQVS